MTTLVWNLDVEPAPVLAPDAERVTVSSLLKFGRPVRGERDPHKERLAREGERDAARKIRRDRYPIPEPDPTQSEWDRLGWRERVLNAHRDRVDEQWAERQQRDRTPPLVMRASTGPEPVPTPVEERNRDHWRDLARRILDKCQPGDDSFDWWGTKPEQITPSGEAEDRAESTECPAAPRHPFEFRRPNAARAIGRATVYPRTNGKFTPHPPLNRPTRIAEPHTVRVPMQRNNTREPEPVGMAGSDDETPATSVHVPRWNLMRRMLLWLFGTRLSRQPLWWAKTCRDCHTEWPCRKLVHELHQRYPTLNTADTAARDSELERLSHTTKKKPRKRTRERSRRRHRRPAPRHLTPTMI
ncbi:hypothetical protein [Stackebrandtia soli]|uniref:hypothetical protein n=1 Tax=Stackebrandtia soli TaxID=1892856 RepID=UPI0039ED2D7D